MTSVKKYLSLIKFSHTIFALPFAFIGFSLGIESIYFTNNIGSIKGFGNMDIIVKLLLVLICMISARSAAMAFNRYLDRYIDAINPRTAIREIPSGIISPDNALRFTVLSCIVFFIACFFINSICFYLSPIAVFVILFYSYTKRFTSWCHLVLGLGLSLAPIGAYLAVIGRFDILPILFSFAVLFWVAGFDIIYALQDVEFDQSQKLFSMPSKFGKSKALWVSNFLHFLSAICIIAAALYGNGHILFWIGVMFFIGMLLYQHSIVSPNDLSKVNIAFMTANGVASVVFSIFVIADLFIY